MGKTVLVSGLMKTSAKLNTTFPGGIYWIYGAGDIAEDPRLACQTQLHLQLPGMKSSDFQVGSWQQGLLRLQRDFDRIFAGARCLVVIDNPPAKEDVLPALQISVNGLLLVISNNREPLRGKSIPDESVLDVGQMDKDDAKELFARWTERKSGSDPLPEAATKVAECLGYHPLGLGDGWCYRKRFA